MMLNVFRLVIVVSVILGTFVPAGASNGIKSYREWKTAKILEAEARLKDLKTKSKDPNLSHKMGSEAGLSEELQYELELEQTNLSLSRDLTISDYFVGYLSKQPSLSAAVNEVAGRLSPAEVAELMLSYADHFAQLHPSSVKMAPRANPGH
jgi:hypothetical protein